MNGYDSDLRNETSSSKKSYPASEMLAVAKRRIVEVIQQFIPFITPIATRCWLAIRKFVLRCYEELESTSQYYYDNRTLFGDYILDLLGMQPPGNNIWLRPHHKSEIYHQNEIDWFVQLPNLCAECGAVAEEQPIDRVFILQDVQKPCVCVIAGVGLGLFLCLLFFPFWLIIPACIISFWAGWRKRRESEGHVVYFTCSIHKNSRRYPVLRLFNAQRQSIIVTVGSRKTAKAFKHCLRDISPKGDQESYANLDPEPIADPIPRVDNEVETSEFTNEYEISSDEVRDDFEYDEIEIS